MKAAAAIAWQMSPPCQQLMWRSHVLDGTDNFCSSCCVLGVAMFWSIVYLFVCYVACCTRGRGLTFTSARVLVRARNRWAKPSTNRHRSPHLLCGLCSHAHSGRATTARVSSPKRLCCPHWLAHAAEHGHFSGASTSGRTIFLWLETVHIRNMDRKIGADSPFAMADIGVCFNACFTPRRALSGPFVEIIMLESLRIVN